MIEVGSKHPTRYRPGSNPDVFQRLDKFEVGLEEERSCYTKRLSIRDAIRYTRKRQLTPDFPRRD